MNATDVQTVVGLYVLAESREFELQEELYEDQVRKVYRNFSPWGHRPSEFDRYVRANAYLEITNHILPHCSNNRSVFCLDGGCGIGSQSILLSALGLRVLGVDLVEERVKLARKRAEFFSREMRRELQTDFLAADLFKLLRGQSFDLIWLREAVSHIHPIEDFFRLCFRCLRPRGLLVVSDANWLHPKVRWELYREYWRTYRPFSRLGESTIYFVTNDYKDPQTGEAVPMAMERVFSPGQLKHKIREAGFFIVRALTVGYVPKSTIAESVTSNLETR